MSRGNVAGQEKAPVSPFETAPCSRCGGSGEYSRCQTWGTACFSCGRPGQRGSGRALTKRGAAAREFYLSLLPRKFVPDLQPGDVILTDHYGKRTVVEVRPDVIRGSFNGQAYERAGFLIVTKGITFAGETADKEYRLVPTVEQRDAAIAKAVAYQETLTKLGKPRKRAPKVTA